MGTTAEGRTNVGSEDAHIGPRRTLDGDPIDAGLATLVDVETVDDDGPGGPLHLDPGARQLVQAAAADLHSRHHGRYLLDGPDETHRGRTYLVERDGGHVVGSGHVAFVVEGRRLDTEDDLAF